MRLLLDTHLLLWALLKQEKLPDAARQLIQSPTNAVHFSAVSIWEIAIKNALGRDDFQLTPEQIATGAMTSGFTSLMIGIEHAAAVAKLPMLHRDPFDRMLIAQALSEPLLLLTCDRKLGEYGDMVRIV